MVHALVMSCSKFLLGTNILHTANTNIFSFDLPERDQYSTHAKSRTDCSFRDLHFGGGGGTRRYIPLRSFWVYYAKFHHESPAHVRHTVEVWHLQYINSKMVELWRFSTFVLGHRKQLGITQREKEHFWLQIKLVC